MKAVKLMGGSVVPAAGEASYVPAFEKICGPRCFDGYSLAVQATLAAEPENPYDPNAVAIYVQSEKVGYIGRKQAADYHAVLLGLSRQDAYGWCDAFIVGGWDRGHGDTGFFGITLDLAPPGFCLPDG